MVITIAMSKSPKSIISELPADYGQFIEDLKSQIRSAQYEALKAVNKEQIALSWTSKE